MRKELPLSLQAHLNDLLTEVWIRDDPNAMVSLGKLTLMLGEQGFSLYDYMGELLAYATASATEEAYQRGGMN